jgi:hypothetical protein
MKERRKNKAENIEAVDKINSQKSSYFSTPFKMQNWKRNLLSKN